jgi:hypothetical protein
LGIPGIDGFLLWRKCSDVAAKPVPKIVMSAGSPVLSLRVSSA